MTSQEYEELTSILASKYAEAFKLLNPVIKLGRSNKWIGKSGHPHQIDVSLETHSEIYLIECKSWNYKIQVEKVLALLGRVQDIGSAVDGNLKIKPIMVTTKGFQRGAIKVAHYYGISLRLITSLSRYDFGYSNEGVAGSRVKAYLEGK
jgi:hypothetical protein